MMRKLGEDLHLLHIPNTKPFPNNMSLHALAALRAALPRQ